MKRTFILRVKKTDPHALILGVLYGAGYGFRNTVENILLQYGDDMRNQDEDWILYEDGEIMVTINPDRLEVPTHHYESVNQLYDLLSSPTR